MEVLDSGLSPSRPQSGGRDRLLEALTGPERYAPFRDDIARHFDLTPGRITELFAEMALPERWEDGPMPGIRLMHFEAGPGALARDTGFVSMPAGMHFPYHRHLGHEVNYVMEGAILDGDGTLYLPGEAIERGPGTEHEYFVPESGDLLMAVMQDGFDIIPKP